jgi:hypothetical protein
MRQDNDNLDFSSLIRAVSLRPAFFACLARVQRGEGDEQERRRLLLRKLLQSKFNLWPVL